MIYMYCPTSKRRTTEGLWHERMTASRYRERISMSYQQQQKVWKKIHRWPSLMTVIKKFLKGSSSKMISLALACVGHFFTRLLLTSLPYTSSLLHFLLLYLPICTVYWDLYALLLYTFQVIHAYPFSLYIDILRFSPESQTLPSIPPNL